MGAVVSASTFTYDPLGRRIGSDVYTSASGLTTQTYTVFDGADPYADFNASGTLLTRYLGGAPVDDALAGLRAGTAAPLAATASGGSLSARKRGRRKLLTLRCAVRRLPACHAPLAPLSPVEKGTERIVLWKVECGLA